MTDKFGMLTEDEIEAFARPFYAANPDATPEDVRAALGTVRVRNSDILRVCERLSPLPTLTTVEDATRFLAAMVARGYEWVAVFWDRGWGDNGQAAEITVIQDGNGQLPLARVTPEVYKELRSSGVIAANSLQTYKARRVHDFVPQAVTA